MWRSSFFCICTFLLCAETIAQEKITTTANSRDPSRPSASLKDYRVKCGTHKYVITIDYAAEYAEINIDGVSVNPNFDQSELGQLVKSKFLVGHLGFSCSDPSINLVFSGYDVKNTRKPVAIEYLATISPDGSVVRSTGLRQIDTDYLQRMWNQSYKK